jgi:hypothetical protein
MSVSDMTDMTSIFDMLLPLLLNSSATPPASTTSTSTSTTNTSAPKSLISPEILPLVKMFLPVLLKTVFEAEPQIKKIVEKVIRDLDDEEARKKKVPETSTPVKPSEPVTKPSATPATPETLVKPSGTHVVDPNWSPELASLLKSATPIKPSATPEPVTKPSESIWDKIYDESKTESKELRENQELLASLKSAKEREQRNQRENNVISRECNRKTNSEIDSLKNKRNVYTGALEKGGPLVPNRNVDLGKGFIRDQIIRQMTAESRETKVPLVHPKPVRIPRGGGHGSPLISKITPNIPVPPPRKVVMSENTHVPFSVDASYRQSDIFPAPPQELQEIPIKPIKRTGTTDFERWFAFSQRGNKEMKRESPEQIKVVKVTNVQPVANVDTVTNNDGIKPAVTNVNNNCWVHPDVKRIWEYCKKNSDSYPEVLTESWNSDSCLRTLLYVAVTEYDVSACTTKEHERAVSFILNLPCAHEIRNDKRFLNYLYSKLNSFGFAPKKSNSEFPNIASMLYVAMNRGPPHPSIKTIDDIKMLDTQDVIKQI